ncbi:hypothetical protein [Algivirga pacifica]|uniref:DUF2393 domain-containing protein n=1 Tax=Algivirga pacifica TaxID=1162670 RepID=A0ABP9DEC2_9BACT
MKEIFNKILEEPKAIIALCAVIISLISLVLSIVTAYQNRKNSRLGVRPLAYIYPPDYEDRIAVIIQNKGTGPLITKELKFTRDNNEKKSYLIDFMPDLEDGYYWETFSKASKIILRPSEEKTLLEFKGDINDPKFIKQRDEIREALSKVQLKMKYTSIFNEKKPFKLDYKLTWFGRNK